MTMFTRSGSILMGSPGGDLRCRGGAAGSSMRPFAATAHLFLTTPNPLENVTMHEPEPETAMRTALTLPTTPDVPPAPDETERSVAVLDVPAEPPEPAPLPDPKAMAVQARGVRDGIQHAHGLCRNVLGHVGSVQEEVERLASVRRLFNEGRHVLLIREATDAVEKYLGYERALEDGRTLLAEHGRQVATVEAQLAEAQAQVDAPIVALERLAGIARQVGSVRLAHVELREAITHAERFSPRFRSAAGRRREAVLLVLQRRVLHETQRDLAELRARWQAVRRAADEGQATLDGLANEGDGFPGIVVPRLVWAGLDALDALTVTQE